MLFCRAAKIPHELKELRIKNGDFRTEEMTKINPFQLVIFWGATLKSGSQKFRDPNWGQCP